VDCRFRLLLLPLLLMQTNCFDVLLLLRLLPPKAPETPAFLGNISLLVPVPITV
jgi:hypothetical protein